MKKDIVDWDKAYALYTAGATYKGLAISLGCGAMTVWQAFKRRGFNTLGARERPHLPAPAAHKLCKPTCEEDAYWLGFLFADGCLSIDTRGKRRPGTVTLVSGIKDVDHMRKFALYIDGYTRIYKDHVAIVSKRSKAWCELEGIGFGAGKTFRLAMPSILPELIPHFIRGFFDGDGWATKDTNQRLPVGKAGFVCAALPFLHELQALFGALNIDSSIVVAQHAGTPYKIKGKTGVRKHNVWHLVIRKIESFNKFHDYLYTNATLYLSRKKDKFAEVIQYRANDCLNKQSLRNA